MRKTAVRLTVIAFAFLYACSPVRKLPEGKFLLTRNVIDLKEGKADKDELLLLAKPKPNRKILFMRFHLGLYTLGDHIFKGWLHKIGEEPVMYDSALVESSKRQLVLYMFRKGYFSAGVSDSVNHWGFKKARVHYSIIGGEPYYIRNITFRTNDTAIKAILAVDSVNTFLKPGDQYDEDIIDNERSRITIAMKNRGYFYFTRNYVNVDVDSSLGTHQVDLYVNVDRINEYSPVPGVEPEDHKIYFLNNIFIQPDFNPANPEASANPDSSAYIDYTFLLSPGKEFFKRKTIACATLFKKNELFIQQKLDLTYTRLADLGTFKFTNIRHADAGLDSTGNRNLLNTYIQLTPKKRMGFTIESEATHSGGNLGIAGSFGYLNRNTFRGAEELEIKLHGSLEGLRNFTDSVEDKRLFFFNTYEFGPEVKLTLKNFLFFEGLTCGTSRFISPRTILSGSYVYQSRPDYKRSILNFSFGYNIQKATWLRLQIFPFEVSSIDVSLTESFQEKILSLPANLSFLYSYRPHLITSGRVAAMYTNQGLRKDNNFWIIRGNFEIAGNTVYAIHSMAGGTKDVDGNYQLFGLTYSQYFKPEIDASYHKWLTEHSSLVARGAVGVGVSYGNSKGKILPFEKAFYGGGANGIRAWRARTLGPGSYRDTSNIEQVGDVKIEANVEYRSVIFKYLEGAVFVDAGNIWLRKDPTNSLEGSTLQGNNILNEYALGAGIGMRINFTFFILRFDGAVKLRDPALLSVGKEWVYGYQKFTLDDITLNFAIGYPF